MIYIIGGAGYENFGDELIVRGWLDHLGREHPDAAVVVDGASKSSLDSNFAERYLNFTGSALVNGLADHRDQSSFWNAALNGATFFDRGGFDCYPDLEQEAARLMEAKVIHLHGGGYLNCHFARKGFVLGLAAAVARRTGARLVGTGLGLVPLLQPTKAQHDAVVDILESFEILETRDPESAELVRAIAPTAKVVTGVDDTFLADLKYSGGGRRLHISMSNDQMGSRGWAAMTAYIREHHGAYDEVIFWRCAKNDQRACEAMKAVLPDIKVLGFSSLVYDELPVGRGDHMLTARFHPHVVAGRGGAVGAFHTSGPYYDVKHGSISNLGSGFLNLSAQTFSPDDLQRRANHLVDDQKTLRSRKLKLARQIYGRPATAARGAGAKTGAARAV